MVVASIDHVSVDERGIAYVLGTSLKVADIIVDKYTWNLTPSQIRDNYPRVSLAEIHSALAYYHDHQSEVDRQIAEADRGHERLRVANREQRSRADFEKRLGSSEQKPQ